MNLYPMGAKLFHTDGQTDMTKLLDAFHNFVSTRKSDHSCSVMDDNIGHRLIAREQNISSHDMINASILVGNM
jgi:D-mannonate dehydratase